MAAALRAAASWPVTSPLRTWTRSGTASGAPTVCASLAAIPIASWRPSGPKGAHHAYLELHIEQGGTLERAGLPIGIVEGIVSIERLSAVVTGFANHAGTTPMPDRQDALVAACAIDPGRAGGRHPRARTPGRHRRSARSVAERAERDPGDRPAHDRASRSVDGEDSRNRRRHPRPRASDRGRDEDDDRDRGSESQPTGAGRLRGPTRHRTGGGRRAACRPRACRAAPVTTHR